MKRTTTTTTTGNNSNRSRFRRSVVDSFDTAELRSVVTAFIKYINNNNNNNNHNNNDINYFMKSTKITNNNHLNI